MTPLRSLLVAYMFPPVGGAGVQRMSKLAKYLPSHGVTPEVLTVTNPSVPLADDSLAQDLPPDLPILRARTFEPGYAAKKAAWEAAAAKKPSPLKRAIRLASGVVRELVYPDPQVLWQPAAHVALSRRLRGEPRPDVVLVSAPPFSQFLVAPAARSLGAAVVLDYRDEWSVLRTEYEMNKKRLASFVGDSLEALLLRRANMVTTATEEFRENLLRRFPFVDPSSVVAIPNGFDPADFPSELPSPPTNRFVVTYVGTVFKLTSPTGLLGAIRRLHQTEPELARLLEVRFIGRVVDLEMPAFAGMEELGVRLLGYMSHGEAIDELAKSHLVLCLLDEAPGVERIYPAKIFELMRLGRPSLTLAPEGALARLVARHRIGVRLPPRDEEGIAAFLASRLRAFRDGTLADAETPHEIERFDRREIAREFARVMREAVRRARG